LAPALPALVVCARRTEPHFQWLEGPHSAGHALAVADTALAAHFDLKDGLTAGFVFDDGHVPKLKAAGFIGPQAGVGREQNIVVKLFRFPLEARLLGFMRALERLSSLVLVRRFLPAK
jgi:hypothetical protein